MMSEVTTKEAKNVLQRWVNDHKAFEKGVEVLKKLEEAETAEINALAKVERLEKEAAKHQEKIEESDKILLNARTKADEIINSATTTAEQRLEKNTGELKDVEEQTRQERSLLSSLRSETVSAQQEYAAAKNKIVEIQEQLKEWEDKKAAFLKGLS